MSVMANDSRRFGADVSDFASAVQRLEHEYVALQTKMAALQGMWTGEAHDTLQARFSADYAELGLVVEYLRQMRASLNNASQAYASCESLVRQTIADLNV